MIKPEGFEVAKAYGGQEGLDRLFSEQQSDILIFDLLMPEISGFEVVARLRSGEQTKKSQFSLMYRRRVNREKY
ncbi:sensory transduction histidine kinase [Methanosarcina sp. WWM596]|nr:sensory transduction histidine kinase [Methanosarcina sp. WWM596]AKB20746.1 sensory transduction histidine kinase [Methanosarcina sp. WH1]